jgi:hypothetical protein
MLPQLSTPVPHCHPACEQVKPVQTHLLGPVPAAPLHAKPGAHMPQSSVPPHKSGAVPQLAPICAHVVGVQPHWFATPAPPHV